MVIEMNLMFIRFECKKHLYKGWVEGETARALSAGCLIEGKQTVTSKAQGTSSRVIGCSFQESLGEESTCQV